MVEWLGRQWEVAPLPPASAGAVAKLAAPDRNAQLSACQDVLVFAGVDADTIIDVAFNTVGDETNAGIIDLIAAILETGTARPWRSTVGLCRTVTTQWSTIRGRLIEKGIADPLSAIPSLTALLDVVEVMILDGMEKEEERDRFIRDLYRVQGVDGGPPPGWEDTADLDSIL